MSIWQDHPIEARIRDNLASVPYEGHHFGRPFLSTYQFPIAFDQRFRREGNLIAKPVGGKDTGRHDSLAKYFANQLSRRIRHRTLPCMEGRFLNGRFVGSLEYGNGGQNRRLLARRSEPVDLPDRLAADGGVGSQADPQGRGSRLRLPSAPRSIRRLQQQR